MLQITSPAQFERFAAEMGEPANTMTMPKPAEVDIPKLLGIVCADTASRCFPRRLDRRLHSDAPTVPTSTAIHHADAPRCLLYARLYPAGITLRGRARPGCQS